MYSLQHDGLHEDGLKPTLRCSRLESEWVGGWVRRGEGGAVWAEPLSISTPRFPLLPRPPPPPTPAVIRSLATARLNPLRSSPPPLPPPFSLTPQAAPSMRASQHVVRSSQSTLGLVGGPHSQEDVNDASYHDASYHAWSGEGAGSVYPAVREAGGEGQGAADRQATPAFNPSLDEANDASRHVWSGEGGPCAP